MQSLSDNRQSGTLVSVTFGRAQTDPDPTHLHFFSETDSMSLYEGLEDDKGKGDSNSDLCKSHVRFGSFICTNTTFSWSDFLSSCVFSDALAVCFSGMGIHAQNAGDPETAAGEEQGQSDATQGERNLLDLRGLP